MEQLLHWSKHDISITKIELKHSRNYNDQMEKNKRTKTTDPENVVKLAIGTHNKHMTHTQAAFERLHDCNHKSRYLNLQ